MHKLRIVNLICFLKVLILMLIIISGTRAIKTEQNFSTLDYGYKSFKVIYPGEGGGIIIIDADDIDIQDIDNDAPPGDGKHKIIVASIGICEFIDPNYNLDLSDDESAEFLGISQWWEKAKEYGIKFYYNDGQSLQEVNFEVSVLSLIDQPNDGEYICWKDIETFLQKIDDMTDYDDRILLHISTHGIEIDDSTYGILTGFLEAITPAALSKLFGMLGPALDFVWMSTCYGYVILKNISQFDDFSKTKEFVGYGYKALVRNETAYELVKYWKTNLLKDLDDDQDVDYYLENLDKIFEGCFYYPDGLSLLDLYDGKCYLNKIDRNTDNQNIDVPPFLLF